MHELQPSDCTGRAPSACVLLCVLRCACIAFSCSSIQATKAVPPFARRFCLPVRKSLSRHSARSCTVKGLWRGGKCARGSAHWPRRRIEQNPRQSKRRRERKQRRRRHASGRNPRTPQTCAAEQFSARGIGACPGMSGLFPTALIDRFRQVRLFRAAPRLPARRCASSCATGRALIALFVQSGTGASRGGYREASTLRKRGRRAPIVFLARRDWPRLHKRSERPGRMIRQTRRPIGGASRMQTSCAPSLTP